MRRKSIIKRHVVNIPHLNYTVRCYHSAKPHPRLTLAAAWISHDNHDSCTIYYGKDFKVPQLAHEIVHVLQYMCQDRHMDLLEEMEHTAYLMQYIMGHFLGYSWLPCKVITSKP